jgi:Ni,Fe-hydrogenase III small subunit
MFYVWRRLWKHGLATMPKKALLRGGGSLEALRELAVPDRDALGTSSPSLSNNRAWRRSIHIRHLDSGSPNDCEWELTALLNPVYDIQRFGFDFVASPRHADMLLVTGGVTRNMEQAVRMTFNATPAPKVVVAVGDDACGTGLVGATYAQFGGVDRIVPVDIYVPGDPPTPADILQGLLQAALKIR